MTSRENVSLIYWLSVTVLERGEATGAHNGLSLLWGSSLYRAFKSPSFTDMID